MLLRLTGYYDGYCFEKTATVRVMNPWSILSFLIYPTRGFRDHWFQTGGQPSILKEFFRSGSLKDPKNFTAVKSIPLEQFGCPAIGDNLSDVDLLTQTGYLSIKSADGNIAIVDYSTEEVRHAMAGMYLHQLLGKTIEQANEIIKNYLAMIHEEKYDESILDEAIVFMNTSRQAARIKCATIGWNGMNKILEGKD